MDQVRRVLFLAPPSLQILDVTGPAEIFARVGAVLNRLGMPETGTYRVELASIRAEPLVSSSCGLSLSPALHYKDVQGSLDTLLVTGGQGVVEAARDPDLVEWVRTSAGNVRRIGSICTGAFVLAAAGVLDGRTVTTHWQWTDTFHTLFPHIEIDSERIFVRDGNVWTSAGITAGMDLALAMVEEDHGHRVAMQIARELVMFLRRPGGQSQFSTALAGQLADHETFKELVPWMMAHMGERLSVEDMAAQAGMSVRHFARVFRERTGHSPASYLERLRVEAACRRLEESSRGTKEVATECGFGDADSLRKAFRRVLNTTPELFRHVFAPPPGMAESAGSMSFAE